MAMVFVIAVGIFAVNMPRVAGGIAVREVTVEKENRLMTTALASLQLGRGMTYYVDLPTFRNFLNLTNHEMTLPTQFQTLNGYEVHLFILNNDADYPNGPGGEFTDTDNTLTLQAQVIERDSGGTILQQIRMAIDIKIISLTQYNYASNNFWGTSNLASRAWYGEMLISAEGRGLTTVNTGDASYPTQQGYDYWNFSGTQYFYGKLHSTGFNSDQSNHQVMSGGEHIVYKHKNSTDPLNPLAVLPTIPTGLDISASVAPGGSIYDRAVTVDKTVIPGGSEIFLNPNGQVWYRPFNSAAGTGWIALRDNNGAGNVVTQDKATILVNGKATVRGVVTGRLTIASTDSIIINGSIENPQYNKAHLGLVAANHIFFENRKIFTESSVNKIYDVRPEDPNDIPLGGATEGSKLTAKATGTSTSNFDFLASEVFTSAEWTSIKGGDMSPFNKLVGGTVDSANYTTDVHKTIGQYQETDFWSGRTSEKGRMPKDGAKVFASLAARWYISASVTYHNLSTTYRVPTEGGTFSVFGTYSLGVGIDRMATWSNSGGLMTYGVHPSQQATAPDYFVPVVQAYPEFVYGSWKRLD
ncbi:MAG: hypothetical protein AB7K09_04060 [Planctomycetota bacterium]